MVSPKRTVTEPVLNASVYHDAAQSIANDTVTALAFNQERYDNGGFHSTVSNNTRLTAPVDGLYEIKGHIAFAAAANGRRGVTIRLNATTNLASQNDNLDAANQACQLSVAREYRLAAGDYVELMAYQNSGGPVNVDVDGNRSPEFTIRRVAP